MSSVTFMEWKQSGWFQWHIFGGTSWVIEWQKITRHIPNNASDNLNDVALVQFGKDRSGLARSKKKSHFLFCAVWSRCIFTWINLLSDNYDLKPVKHAKYLLKMKIYQKTIYRGPEVCSDPGHVIQAYSDMHQNPVQFLFLLKMTDASLWGPKWPQECLLTLMGLLPN